MTIRYIVDTSTKVGESLADKLSTPTLGVVALTAEEMELYRSSSCIDLTLAPPCTKD